MFFLTKSDFVINKVVFEEGCSFLFSQYYVGPVEQGKVIKKMTYILSAD